MRVVIRTEDWEAVGFNIPVAEFHTARSLERSSQVPRLGPDILSESFSVESGVARLAAYARENPDAEVGVVLLNQQVMAGLGNVYKSEVAFAAGVNPFRAMRTITPREMERMVEFCEAVHEGECRGWFGGWDCDVLGKPEDDARDGSRGTIVGVSQAGCRSAEDAAPRL